MVKILIMSLSDLTYMKGFFFEPFGWYLLVSEEREIFYSEVSQISLQTGIILASSLAVSLALLLLFARYLTRPLTKVVGTMKDIISYNDLSERVLKAFPELAEDLPSRRFWARSYLMLTGAPPTPQRVQSFIQITRQAQGFTS